MATTIDKADAYSRPNARFDEDGQLEIRASASGNCRRALWYDRHRTPALHDAHRGFADDVGGGERP